MKVCFIGLGSIGIRHLKNLIKLTKSRKINLEVDAIRSGKGKPLADLGIHNEINHVYFSYDDAPDDYDVIFLTNPTSLHYQTLLKVKNKSKHFFVEKPVFHTSKVDISMLKFRQDQIFYVACPMRYEKVMQYVKNTINMEDVFCARSICSSYLPDWRKGTDYRTGYSAHKEMGGGVSLDLIHEWDYMSYLLSFPDQVYSFIQKRSNLEIDSDDIAVYIGKNHKCIYELHLDYFGREEIRQLQLFKEESTILIDFLKGTIWDSETEKELFFSEGRDDYQSREIACFLDMIEKKRININNLETALKVLKLAEGIN